MDVREVINSDILKHFFFCVTLQATMKQQLSQNWKFHIPDLKVGTLDQLVGLSDDLGKAIYSIED